MKTMQVILENGQVFKGTGFGSCSEKILEIVFNTSMAGYQEIISDPSYNNQAVVMTYPLIGNYGINPDDFESKNPVVGGLIVREYNPDPSNFRSKWSLGEVMEKYDITGVSGIDTRTLTRKIRDIGSCKVLITDKDISLEEAKAILKNHKEPHDGVDEVSTKNMWESNVENAKYKVAAIDCGMKLNIVRELNKAGCSVTVVPYTTSFEVIEAMKPDGIFVSNGPGDPEDVIPVIETLKKLRGRYPIFGICLGHQLLSLSYGAKTYKLKFGHRGGNHPVMNLQTGKIEITSQNHSYAVDKESLEKAGLEVTHINLLDNTVEGMRCVRDKVFSIQYHPESAPGPQDSTYLFRQFTELMKEGKENA